MSPGSTRLRTPPADGLTRFTVGIACERVAAARPALARSRLTIPKATMPAAAASTMPAARLSRFGRVYFRISSSLDIGISCRRCAGMIFIVACMHDAEDGGHEHQRGAGGKDQTADHGAAERGVLFTALAEAERHRRHADD